MTDFENNLLVLLTAIERHLSKLADRESEEGDEIDAQVAVIRESLREELARS